MNENRVAVILAEGGSEKAFLTSLLQTGFGFQSVTGKGSICFKNPTDDLQVWLFPVPALGKTHAGGKSELVKQEPYIKADTVVTSHQHILTSHPHIHYFVLTDTDGVPTAKIQEKERDIISAFQAIVSGAESIEVHFPNKEIEAWLMAGLTADFPYFSKGGWDILQAEETRLEQIPNPKEFFDAILLPSLAGSRISIGDRVGSHFDIGKARSLSPSFQKFISSLETKGLL